MKKSDYNNGQWYHLARHNINVSARPRDAVALRIHDLKDARWHCSRIVDASALINREELTIAFINTYVTSSHFDRLLKRSREASRCRGAQFYYRLPFHSRIYILYQMHKYTYTHTYILLSRADRAIVAFTKYRVKSIIQRSLLSQ